MLANVGALYYLIHQMIGWIWITQFHLQSVLFTHLKVENLRNHGINGKSLYIV